MYLFADKYHEMSYETKSDIANRLISFIKLWSKSYSEKFMK